MPLNVNPEPVVPPVSYAPDGPGPAVGTTPAVNDQMLQFQLPPELLNDWPWPLDNSQPEGFFPLPFE